MTGPEIDLTAIEPDPIALAHTGHCCDNAVGPDAGEPYEATEPPTEPAP